MATLLSYYYIGQSDRIARFALDFRPVCSPERHTRSAAAYWNAVATSPSCLRRTTRDLTDLEGAFQI
jgi:hypothetical protein